jgi:hypothetical protein
MQQELETAFLELIPAKTIIELLQDETNSTARNKTTNTQGNLYDSSALNSDLEKNTSGN